MLILNKVTLQIIVLLITLLPIKLVTAQEWVKYYGEGENYECRHVIEDYDRGFLIAGNSNLYGYLMILKIDINGEVIWNKKFGNGIFCISGNIEKTSDGGSIICGTWQSNQESDAMVLKVNACAELEWCKTLYTPGTYDLGMKIKPTNEGDYLLLSFFESNNPYSRTSLFKLNNNGNIIWHQLYPLENSYNNDEPYDLLTDIDDYLVLTSRYHPDPGTTLPAIERHHLFKSDTAGNLLWDLVYGDTSYYYGGPWCLKKSNSNAYYEAGRHLQPNLTESSPGFVKISTDGIPLYNADVMNNVGWGGLSSIDILQDSLLIMLGGYTSHNDTSYDTFFKTDTLGNLKKIKIIPKAYSSYWSAVKSFDEKFIAIGNDYHDNSRRIVAVKVNSDLEYDSIYTQPFTYDSLCPHPIVSETINPTCDNVIVKVDEPFKEPSTTQLKVYPNPSDNLVTVELPKYLVVSSKGNSAATTIHHQWSKATLQLIDLQGKIHLEKEVSQSMASLQIDVSHLATGMYQFRLLYQGNLVAGSKVMVK